MTQRTIEHHVMGATAGLSSSVFRRGTAGQAGSGTRCEPTRTFDDHPIPEEAVNSPRRGIFVTGTDTGVGKTLVSAGLVRLALDRGLCAKALKPIETGCPVRFGILYPEDGAFLVEASNNAVSLDECTPFRFSLPASPYRAAALEGKRIHASDVVEHVLTVAETADFVVVEGAGGLMVPIDDTFMMIDLIERLQYPTLLVARTSLGTINHTLLSIDALQHRSLEVCGIVLCKASSEDGPEEEFTAGDIQRLVRDIPVVAIPFLPADHIRDAARLAETLRHSISDTIIERWLRM